VRGGTYTDGRCIAVDPCLAAPSEGDGQIHKGGVDERHVVVAVSPTSELIWIYGLTVCFRISSLPQLTLAVMELDNLLIQGGQPLRRTSSTSSTMRKKGTMDEPYDRSAYWTYAGDRKKAFSKLYAFCFALAKPP
jgi:hypothetical protein